MKFQDGTYSSRRPSLPLTLLLASCIIGIILALPLVVLSDPIPLEESKIDPPADDVRFDRNYNMTNSSAMTAIYDNTTYVYWYNVSYYNWSSINTSQYMNGDGT